MDIYKSSKQEDGTWEPLQNMGPAINTPYEDAPFLSLNGKALYFSSSGHNTIGGYLASGSGLPASIPGFRLIG